MTHSILSEAVQQAGAWALAYLYIVTFLGRVTGFNRLDDDDEPLEQYGPGAGELACFGAAEVEDGDE